MFLSRDRGLACVEKGVLSEHREDNVTTSAGEGDEWLVLALALSNSTVEIGAGDEIS